MRPAFLRSSLALFCIIYFSGSVFAQNCFNTGLNGTVINLPCNQNCVNVPIQIPHLKSTDDYKVVSVPYAPFPYVSAAPALSNGCPSQDDKFFDTTFLPFTFCFYGAQYTKLVVGTNGLVTFDTTNALQGNNWELSAVSQVPYTGAGNRNPLNTTCPQPSGELFPRASIMGGYYDIYIDATNFPNRKMQVDVYGTAPCRKFVISYFEIPLFQCNTIAATEEIVLYESTGLIDVYIANKPACTWNEGRAVIGIQNWNRDLGIAAPGKNSTQWSEQNTGYRFIPSGSASRFVRCEVYNIGGGTLLAVGDTATTTPGLLDVTFPSFCPTGTGGQYVVKTIFSACDNAANQIVSYDTITINKTTSLNAALGTTTPTSCGVSGSGTATINVPAGIGTAPYTFVLSPGGTTLTGNSPQQFTGLNAGNYTVAVSDAGGSCGNTVPFTITSTGVLSVNFTTTNTSCWGDSVRNGTLHVTPPNGTPPLTYTLIHPSPPILNLTQVNNGDFNSLYAGDYFLSVHDNAGCEANNLPFTILPGPSISLTYTTTPTSCPGATNGSITITGTTGTAPVMYSINGGLPQSNPVFSNLAAGTYFISLIDANKCEIRFYVITVDPGPNTVTGTAAPTVTTCAGVNDGKITVTPTTGGGPYDFSINNGTTWQTSNVFTGLAPGTYTILIRSGGMCISAPIQVTITAGAGLQGTATQTSTTCTGANNGKITVTMSSGTGPYTFKLDGTITQTSPTNTTIFNNVSAGPHSVTVTDANGCTTTAAITVTVTAGAGFTATVTPTPTGCAGVNNGSLVITPQTPAVGPFTITLNPGAISQASPTAPVTFNNLAAGTYGALVTDGNGCQLTLSNMVVTAGAGLVGTSTSTNTTCTGISNGSISINMGSGTAPYTAVMDGTVTQTSATNVITFGGVAAGPHSVSVTDASGCVTTTPITTTVVAGAGFTATFTPVPTGCAGVNNGSLLINPQTPASAPYTVLLNPGAVSQTSPTLPVTFSNLAPGSYNALITDASGCQFTLSNMTITAGAGLTAVPAPTGTSCAGVNNGSIAVTMGSGAAPYTAIMDGSTTQISATNIITFTGVAAGPHSITVTDANGCVTTSPVTTTVPAGTGFTASFAPTPTGCAGASNGKLTLTVQNPGTAPFTTVLNPGAITQTSPTQTILFNNLAAGTYSAVVTDANGCQFTLSNMVVASGTALNALPAAISTSCNGAINGSINVQPATNGTAPYLYSLNSGTPQASPAFPGLAAGNYIINVTDAGGCNSGSLNVTVSPGPSINVRPDKIDATCFNSTTGSINAVPSVNATAPVQYSLDNVTWQASPNFTSLAAGTYNVYIIDAVGCTNSADTTIGQPAQLTATPSQQSVLCNSGNTGKIFINAAGGVPPYSYSLDNITFQPASQFNVAAGTYTVYVKDANGCTVPPLTVNVTEPAALTAASITGNATCDGGSDGTITITAGGGVTPYQYAITGGGFQATNYFNVGPGTYDITIKDVNGCSYQVTGVVVGLTNNLTYTPMTDQSAVCEGNGVQLQLVTNATQFTWTNGGSLSSTTIANPIAKPSNTTSYTVTATLGRCSIQDDVLVSIMPAPVPNAGVVPADGICYGQNFQLQGSGGINYRWSPSTYLSSTTIANPLTTPEKTITYSLSVDDANGCSSLVPALITVKVTPPIKVTVYPADTIVYAGAQIPMLAISAATDYTWSTASGVTGLDNSYVANPTATAPLADGSVVVYKVTATTAAGCQGDAYARIQVYKGPDIYMVTGFTPNGDGKNDLFVPLPVGIKEIKYFKVLNRWGQVLYSTSELNKGWDGKLGTMEQPSGVYVWMVQGITKDNKIITKKGTVTLIR